MYGIQFELHMTPIGHVTCQDQIIHNIRPICRSWIMTLHISKSSVKNTDIVRMKMKYLQRYFNINATFGIKSENQEEYFFFLQCGSLYFICCVSHKVCAKSYSSCFLWPHGWLNIHFLDFLIHQTLSLFHKKMLISKNLLVANKWQTCVTIWKAFQGNWWNAAEGFEVCGELYFEAIYLMSS